MTNFPELYLRLPIYIVGLIIDYTSDPETIEHWCVATEPHPILHHYALQNRWSNVALHQDDLVAPPQYREGATTLPSGLVKSLCEAIKWGPATSSRRQTHPNPAAYIQHLKLPFCFRTGPASLQWRLMEESGEYSESILGPAGLEHWHLSPKFEDIEYSLALVLQRATHLKSVCADGTLNQKLVTQIVEAAPKSLSGLKLWRTPCANSWVFRDRRLPSNDDDDDDDDGKRDEDLIMWHSLGQLRFLRTLEIKWLRIDEARSLAEVVERLTNLENLLVVAAPSHSATSSLNLFLDYVFPSQQPHFATLSHCRLPSSLKSFGLSDCHET